MQSERMRRLAAEHEAVHNGVMSTFTRGRGGDRGRVRAGNLAGGRVAAVQPATVNEASRAPVTPSPGPGAAPARIWRMLLEPSEVDRDNGRPGGAGQGLARAGDQGGIGHDRNAVGTPRGQGPGCRRRPRGCHVFDDLAHTPAIA